MNSREISAQKPKFSVAITTEKYKKLINNTLGDPERARRFVAAITSAVAVNPALQECDAGSILSGALLGESLNLSPSPQLGQYYLVPYNNNKTGVKGAQFQLGYKGYLQLAIRSGQYKKIVVSSVKAGELEKYDPINEEIVFQPIMDDELREAAETIGYYAMFEYVNGFRKAIYWSRAKMENHARKYSKAYGKKPDSLWNTEFDKMAYKTLLMELIRKWGILSIDMQTAVDADGRISELNRDGNPEYIEPDTAPQPQAAPEPEPEPEPAAFYEPETPPFPEADLVDMNEL